MVRGERWSLIASVLVVLALIVPPASGQDDDGGGDDDAPAVPAEVEIDPAVSDAQIAARLERILEATGWFTGVAVRVDNGVVFLDGTTTEETYQEWAGELAGRTEGVVAVVNRINVAERAVWDFSPSIEEIRRLWGQFIGALPLIAIGFLLLIVTVIVTMLTARVARRALVRRMRNPIILDVAVKLVAVPVFLLGVYIVLRIAGLTGLAVTILGGTGLAGLIIGIAFRDIAENFLASLLISTQRPFRVGDIIEVEGRIGIVQKVTTRGTLLMGFDGNHIQIPNSTIYKSMIINRSANPKVRNDFIVGIGYDASLQDTQSIIMDVLKSHEAVLADPEPMILVENLGAASVALHIYFWIDGKKLSQPKVKSSVMRLVKRTLQEAGVPLPDEARERLVEGPISVRLIDAQAEGAEAARQPARAQPPAPRAREEEVATAAEGGLGSETPELEAQARASRPPEEGVDLLGDEPSKRG